MSQRKLLISILILIVFLSFKTSLNLTVLANGGPIDSNGLVQGGNIFFVTEENISLESEELFIDINSDSINVKVNYSLKNLGKDRLINYGFPINLYTDEFSGTGKLEDIKMYDGNNELKYTEHTEIKTRENSPNDPIFDNPSLFAVEIRTYITDISFKENETKDLTVSYTVAGSFLDWGTTKTFFPRFDTEFFSYNLIPAANWGDGLVDDFIVIIDYKDILASQGNITRINLDGYTQVEEGVYQYKATDFDLDKQGEITISYDNTKHKFTNFVNSSRINNEYINNITTSSSLGNRYLPKNLFDANLDTAWVEGVSGLGENEWIEIEFNRGVHLGTIGLLNGYTSDKTTFNNNGQIKKLRLEVYSFDNINGEQFFHDEIINLDKRNYDDLNKSEYASFIDFLVDFGEGYTEISKIRLTILDAYQGAKYEDTCLSELYLLGWVDQETIAIDDINDTANSDTTSDEESNDSNIDEPYNEDNIEDNQSDKSTTILIAFILISLVTIFVIGYLIYKRRK